MALTVDKALAYVQHALDGLPDGMLDPEDLLNQVGQIYVGAYEWNFLNRRVERLAVRKEVTAAAALYLNASKSLTLASAFASYDFVVGDYVTATYLGATIAQVDVASRVDDHTITLATNALAALDGQNVDIVVDTARMELPADWAGNLAMSATELYTRNLVKSTPDEFLNLRTQQVSWAGISTWVCPMWHKTKDAEEPTPVLEVWPAPSADDWNAFSLNYQAGWADITGSTSVIPIPKHCEPSFLALMRAYVLGLEEAEGGDVDDRVAKVLAGPLFQAAIARDAQQEYDYGPMAHTSWDDQEIISLNQALVWGSDTILPT